VGTILYWKLPAAPILAATSYQELFVSPSSVTLHLPAKEGDCLTALVTTHNLVTKGLETIPQLHSKDDKRFHIWWHCYQECAVDNKHTAICDELWASTSFQAMHCNERGGSDIHIL
jgi:hypothetical protein